MIHVVKSQATNVIAFFSGNRGEQLSSVSYQHKSWGKRGGVYLPDMQYFPSNLTFEHRAIDYIHSSGFAMDSIQANIASNID